MSESLNKFLRKGVRKWAGKKGGVRPGPLMFFSSVYLSLIWLFGPRALDHLLEFLITAALIQTMPHWEIVVQWGGTILATLLSFFALKPFWRAVMLCFPDYFQTWDSPDDDS